MITRPANVMSLKESLPVAQANGFAIGAFSARSTVMVMPILQAAQDYNSPVICQISQKELAKYVVTPQEFADEVYKQIRELGIRVPVMIHLDHTKVMDIIEDAVDAGFTSVMIDASEKELDDNIQTTREVVEFAHAHGVAVEAELGRIGTTDMIETDEDVTLYTVPEEALRFVQETKVDALAVSVGTAHGVYLVKQPTIDFQRLVDIRALSNVALVLHGGSGVPAEMMRAAITSPGGGVSKVNIATDLELAYLQALQREKSFTNAELKQLDAESLAVAQKAVYDTTQEKMDLFLGSRGKADHYHHPMEK
jgi:ketose-bisphosphate aldolase